MYMLSLTLLLLGRLLQDQENSAGVLAASVGMLTSCPSVIPLTTSPRQAIPHYDTVETERGSNDRQAIGDMYGDDHYTKSDRPLSFAPGPLNDAIDGGSSDSKRMPTRPSASTNGNPIQKSHTSPGMIQSPRSSSFDKGPLSPALSLRDHGDTANKQFPLNDIDYESNPAAVAQELSNLQALRRMSMDVGNQSDPDLPSFQGVSLMPSVAPTGNDDEDDPSRLFWVPARVHPELAPMEFKTFLENRVQSIKRRSGDQTSLAPGGVERNGSESSLRRKKSMLSRQINNEGGRGAVGYKDGAEQLERKKSLSAKHSPDLKISDLKELDELVRDPTKAMQKLSLDTGRHAGVDGSVMEEDMPILPQAPGIGLRRSTRTTYRRGSLRKEGRVPFGDRKGSLRGETDTEDSPISASPIDIRQGFGYPLTKVQSEPTTTENFSRPSRGGRRLQNLPQASPSGEAKHTLADVSPEAQREESRQPQPGQPPRSNTAGSEVPVPRIVEVPPPPEENVEMSSKNKISALFPERSSSQKPAQVIQKQSIPEPPAKSSRRPTIDRGQPVDKVAPALNDMAQHPSPLPGNSARTDALTIIPTMDEKKSEKKSKKNKEDSDSGSRKTSWGWFKGSDGDKKDKKKDDDHKKSKSKAAVDKSHDTARLDVLQSTMETSPSRGRESLIMERDSMDSKLQEERSKESSRKSGSENKKEKDGLFSSFFGGKKKSDRDSGGKKARSERALSPDPPHRQLKPDIDYSWTRFTMLEERAIYRMAHIKLANPRRALYSQVLLSNFMYSYLAKVQQMHPQMNIPQSALQKKQEAERKRKEQEQQARERGEENYRYDYHSGIAQYAEQAAENPNPNSTQTPPPHEGGGGVEYVDDSQIYDYDHQDDDSNRPQSRASQHSTENGQGEQSQSSRQGKDYYPYGQSGQSGGKQPHGQDDDDEMW
ncbi:hypothetical protein HYFRA_00008496 [Hymenoscyphus fraxineus]|uniref:Protein Zds1 C-terminal domain-containing protein n=1 Tax=Hymenoscyphus fraxineus TaxID=746836 RepID=A0A9N9PP36_9HELO|nr:hypothetical protein HYFRA_00008496 [Hymenoscyphus fraxineus]